MQFAYLRFNLRSQTNARITHRAGTALRAWCVLQDIRELSREEACISASFLTLLAQPGWDHMLRIPVSHTHPLSWRPPFLCYHLCFRLIKSAFFLGGPGGSAGKALVTKTGNLSLILRAHTVGREDCFLQAISWLPYACWVTCM